MLRHTARRIVQAIPLLLLVSVISFAVMQLAPGGPLAAYQRNPHIPPAQLVQVVRDFGLDRPAYVQYLYWLAGLLHGDWGYSLGTGEPVLGMIGERLGNTLVLVGTAFLLALTLAIPLAIISAVRRYSALDYLFTFCSFAAWSAPVFWVGFMAQLVFAVNLGWLPTAGLYTEGVPWSLGDFLKHLALPALVLGLGNVASWSRYLRGSLLDVMGQDYIRTARAKGVRARLVLYRHALRNALIPLVTIVALDLPTLFTGVVLVEIVFSWPGMGRLFASAIAGRDYILLQGLLLIAAALIVAGNLLADLVYGLLDPRVQYS